MRKIKKEEQVRQKSREEEQKRNEKNRENEGIGQGWNKRRREKKIKDIEVLA